jgi:hypothetical protein
MTKLAVKHLTKRLHRPTVVDNVRPLDPATVSVVDLEGSVLFV